MVRWLWLWLVVGVPAFAQAGLDGGSDASADAGSEVTSEQQAEILRALQQDAAANARAGGQSAPPEAVSQAPGTTAAAAPGAFSLQSLNPDLSFIADVALAAFDRPQQTVGELELQAGGHDPKHNGFNLQQLEMAVGKSVDPYLRFDANLVFGQEGVELEEAYATTLTLPAQLQLRAGKFLTRFGRLNPTHPHTWDFVDQPFILSKLFGGEGNRGVGLELSWLTPLPWYVELVGEAIQPDEAGATRSFIDVPEGGPSSFRIRGASDFEYVGAIKQFFPLSDDLSLMWGLSGAVGPNAQTEHSHSLLLGTDLYLKYRPLTEGSVLIVSFQGEGFYRRRWIDGDVLTDGGAYAYAFCRFAQRWATALRYEVGTPARGLEGTVADDYLDPDWTGTRQRLSANLTFWPTEFSRLRLQGALGTLASSALSGLGTQNTWSVFLALEVAIGAHGAHQF